LSIKQPSSNKQRAYEGFEFILSHFEEPIWPRTISTNTTEGRAVLVCNKKEALARFEQANFLDCRISAYPGYTQWNGINRQAPNFIFIDLDLSNFKSREALDRGLKKTLKNIRDKLDNAQPSVIWSGNGYHLYLPTKALVLESESVFASFENPSVKFLRFAESYLSNNKADPSHGNSLSFRNCMLRIPGSHNSKCVLRNNGIIDSSTEVKIVQRWDGRRPTIKWLLRDLRRYLIQEKIDVTFRPRAKKSRKRYSNNYPTSHTFTNNHSNKWPWIERLLETPIVDYRKFVMWSILAPYFINVKKLSYDEAFGEIRNWLGRCDRVRRLDFNIDNRIKDNLGAAIKVGYLPISLNKLKEQHSGLFGFINH
jgi:hypothetical protein